ncbi:MAG: HlyD family type I secretion periplasmic adaptor subunit, partial [Casimicrobiaceae bacterium]
MAAGGIARDRPPSARGAATFHADPLRLVEHPPSPLARHLLFGVTALVGLCGLWLAVGSLDIVAVANGKLVPRTSLKIVQPMEAGIVAEIAVLEGQSVLAGQLLLRLEPDLLDADTRAMRTELARSTLQLRRIDAELAGAMFAQYPADPDELFARASAQYTANRRAFNDALAHEASAVQRIEQELQAAMAMRSKLQRTVPIYQTSALRYAQLQSEGFVSELFALEKQRDRIEKELDLAAQEHAVEALRASIDQARHRLAQVTSANRAQLHVEQFQAGAQRSRVEEDLAKQLYRTRNLELRAPVAGTVKDLATHTVGTVVSPGTILLTLVPAGDELQADVIITNLDAGFVRKGQFAKVKVATFPFQKYGVVDG